MISTRFVLVVVCAFALIIPTGCNRNKIADEKNEELTGEDFKEYITPALENEHQIKVEASADENLTVIIIVREGDKEKELAKANKSKSITLEAKVPGGKEAVIKVRPEKKCTVKTSIKSV